MTLILSLGQMFNALGVGVSFLLAQTIVTKHENEEGRDHLHDITVLLSVYSGRFGFDISTRNLTIEFSRMEMQPSNRIMID